MNRVMAAGNQYLDGSLEEYCHRAGDRFVNSWRQELMALAAMAEMQPQAAYAVLTKGLIVQMVLPLESIVDRLCHPGTFR